MYNIAFLTAFILLSIYLLFRSKRRLDVRGKSILITGCDSGIGLYLAQSLHDRGFSVIATCLSSSSDGYTKLTEISSNSDSMRTVIMDVTVNKSVQNCVKEVERITDSNLWGIINNAGICVFGEFDWLTWNQCEKQVAVNFLGLVRVTKFFLPLIKRSSGRILSISSVNGFVAFPGAALYSGTKFSVEGFSDSLRIELKKLGIGVVIIQLGDMAKCTNIMMNHRSAAEEMRKNMSNEDKELYEGYFEPYHENCFKDAGCAGPAHLESTSLVNDVEDSLLLEETKPRVLISTSSYALFIRFLQIMPTCIRDSILQQVITKFFKLEFKGYKNR